jgi:HD-like signal output (HDOD) protein
MLVPFPREVKTMTPDDLVQEVSSLFSLPEVAVRVNELLDAPNTTIQDLSEVIQLDAGLTSRLLRLANSAYYGLPSKVETVSLAITMIGQRTLRDLVLSTSVVSVFKDIPSEFVDMRDFWDNSTTCGVVARNLGRLCRMRDSEHLFIAGLLHAVGRLVFYARRPQQYREVLRASGLDRQALVAEERRVFGFTYADLGAALLRAWRLPEVLHAAVAHHLEPGRATVYTREVAIVHVARDVADGLTPDIKAHASLADYTPGFDAEAWESLGLDTAVLPDLRQTSLYQAFEVLEIINPRATLIY